MKKFIVSFCLLCIASTSFAQQQMVFDANAQPRTLEGSFDRIKVSHAIDVYLSQSETVGLAVSASDEKYLQGIETVINDGELRISYIGDRSWGDRNRKLKVYISFVQLKALEASGASDVQVAGTMRTESFSLTLSGASDFKGSIIANSLKVQSSGASDVNISGRADKLKIESSGASDFKGYDFSAGSCRVDCSGASDVRVTVTGELSAETSGASSVIFKGNAVIKNMQASGSSRVSRKS